MKQARIALGVILVAGILAVLLSWPERRERINLDPKYTFSNIYDKMPFHERIKYYPRSDETSQLAIALNDN